MTDSTIHGDVAAVVHLEGDEPAAQRCWAVVKRTYRIAEGRLEPIEPLPLLHDVRDEDLAVQLPPGSDYRPFKRFADVVVLGSAFAPGGRPTAEMSVSVYVGDAGKRVAVLGDRLVTWTSEGAPVFGSPEPFTQMPLGYENAYGGVDERLQPAPAKSFWDALRNDGDPVGAYPRNPIGKGYVTIAARVGDLALPNLEDPDHRLTPENLIAVRPERWFEQPLPWALGWTPPMCFPRPSLLGARLRFPVDPSHRLEEVARGLLPEAWRDLPGTHFFQEASLGMTFHDLRPGTPIRLRGMHPERPDIELTVPEPPRMAIDVEGDREPVAPRIVNVVLTPHEERIEVTWAAERSALPRVFLLGVHPVIPITLWVDGRAVPLVAPPSVSVQLAAARRDGRLAATGMRLAGADALELAGRLGVSAPTRDRDQVPHADAPRLGPIDPCAGRLLLRAADWTSAGYDPLVFERHYSSSMAWREGALGPGWSHCLEQAVWRQGRWLMHRMADGTELGLPLPGGRSLAVGSHLHHARAGVTVRRLAPDAYDVVHADGARFSFRSVHGALSVDQELARLAEVWRPDGTSFSLRYDTRGVLDRLELGDEPLARFEHDEGRRLRRVFARARDGRDWVLAAAYEYSGAGRLIEARDGRGRADTYRYRGSRLTEEASAGTRRRFEYDGAGVGARCVAVIEEEGARAEVSFDTAARVVGLYTAGGASFSGVTDDAHALTLVRDVFAHQTARVYDEGSRQLVSQVDASGETTFLRDSTDQLVEVVAPARGRVGFEYGVRGQLERLVGADGAPTTWGWSVDGRLIVAADRAGASVLYDQPLDAPLVSIRTPLEVRLTLERDERTGQVMGVRSPLGARRARRDAQRRICEVVDESGAATAYRHDAAGRPCRVESPAGVVTTYDSDRAGRILERHDGVTRRAFERDARGRLAQLTENGVGPRLHRDVEGRVSVFESEAFDLWEFMRDAAGRVVEELGFGGEERYARRDHRGLVVRALRGRSRSAVTRDAAGRPVEIEHSDGGLQRYAWSPGGQLLRAQDADRAVTFARDRMGRIVEEVGEGVRVRSGYDPSGARVSVDGAAGVTVRVDRDVIGGAVSLVAEAGGARLELRFDRDASGREVRRWLPGELVLRTERDLDGRPVKRVIERRGREVSGTRYGWAGLDRMTSLVDARRGRRVHVHDARGGLVRVGSSVRALDEIGCVYRAEARDDHRYGPGGRLLESYGTVYGYDGEGRRTSRTDALGDEVRYEWDGLGRLIGVRLRDGERIAYAYDGLGRLAWRRRESRVTIPGIDEPVWEASHETRFVWDGLTLLHTLVDDAVTTWIWEAGRLVGMLTPAGGYAVLTEPNGAPTEALDADGATVWRGSVDVFGGVSAEVEAVEMPWRFAGHWADPDTGLLHAWLRVYDPETGAYLTPNPLGVIAGANLYGYLPDPLSHTSPLGLGRGYEVLGGEVASERLEAELIGRFVAALDRADGGSGPRSRFDREAARHRLPEPEAALFGPWERYRPHRNLPPPIAAWTGLPRHLGLSGGEA